MSSCIELLTQSVDSLKKLDSDWEHLKSHIDSINSQLTSNEVSPIDLNELNNRFKETLYIFDKLEMYLPELTEKIALLHYIIDNSYTPFKEDEALIGEIVIAKRCPSPEDKFALRIWWHEVLRSKYQHKCFAVFLFLPSDTEVCNYLNNNRRELDLISKDNCLILAIGNTDVRQLVIQDDLWKATISEQANEGYSLKIAEQFGISFSTFPCMVIFEDIRSSEYILINLQNLHTEEIIQQMRLTFSTIDVAAKNQESPLKLLTHKRHKEEYHKASKTIVSEMYKITGKAIDTIMEVLIKTSIK